MIEGTQPFKIMNDDSTSNSKPCRFNMETNKNGSGMNIEMLKMDHWRARRKEFARPDRHDGKIPLFISDSSRG